MPSIYDIKPKFQAVLRPLCRWMANHGINANMVTVGTLILSILVGVAVALYAKCKLVYLILPIFLLVRMALNAIDGMLAREYDQKSNLGAILNELGDVIADIALYMPFGLLSFPFAKELVFSAIAFAIIVEMSGVVAVQIGASRRYDGPMGKSDRAFAFSILAILVGLGVDMAWWGSIFLSLILLLSVMTILNRCKRALNEIS